MTKAEKWVPYFFLAPALLLIVFFRLLPAFSGFLESLYATSFAAGGVKTFVGLRNFQDVFADPVGLQSIWVTLRFNLIVNPLQIGLALLLALLVNQALRGIDFFRSIYLLPIAISLNVTAIIWGLVLNQYGLMNGLLRVLGLPAQPFLQSPNQALWSIIMMASWVGVAYWALFILAGLQGIPTELYEAAEIDGTGVMQRFMHITLPLLRKVLVFVLVADTVANFLLFVPVLILTSGGPQLSTNTLMFEAYRRGFIFGDFGTSSAMIMLLLGATLAIVAIEFWLLRTSD
ncbi:MAG: sugar ABC transporter permease [Caldilineaceae bacterium]|nr:sugar ABC transporter permease [Caldilineaceae bacterium]